MSSKGFLEDMLKLIANFDIDFSCVLEGEREDIPPNCPLKDLIEQCWDQDHTKRPTIGEILDKIATIRHFIAAGGHQLAPTSPDRDIVHSVVEDIPCDELRRTEFIAEGGFGKVHSCM